MDDHNVDTFVSLAGPQGGVFGPDFFASFEGKIPSLENVTADAMWLVACEAVLTPQPRADALFAHHVSCAPYRCRQLARAEDLCCEHLEGPASPRLVHVGQLLPAQVHRQGDYSDARQLCAAQEGDF
eukprot:2209232-Prymnesium_polylepis.1